MEEEEYHFVTVAAFYAENATYLLKEVEAGVYILEFWEAPFEYCTVVAAFDSDTAPFTLAASCVDDDIEERK